MSDNSFPRKINVMGIPFRGELVAHLTSDGEKVDGETIGDLRLIRVCSNQDLRRKWTTLYHEYIHAALHVVGLGNVLGEEIEEVIAQTLEHANEIFNKEHGDQYLSALKKNS